MRITVRDTLQPVRITVRDTLQPVLLAITVLPVKVYKFIPLLDSQNNPVLDSSGNPVMTKVPA